MKIELNRRYKIALLQWLGQGYITPSDIPDITNNTGNTNNTIRLNGEQKQAVLRWLKQGYIDTADIPALHDSEFIGIPVADWLELEKHPIPIDAWLQRYTNKAKTGSVQ